MDELWTEHLESITDLREGIGLRGYAQRDPLVEYKNESFDLFETLMTNKNNQIAKRILKIRRVTAPIAQVNNILTNENQISDIITGSREMGLQPESPKLIRSKPIFNISKAPVGRNDPCPCGSGLKYKKCGLINSPMHRVTS